MEQEQMNDVSAGESKNLPGWKRFLGLYFSPGEVFRSLSTRPDWLLPCLVVTMISVASGWLLWPRVILPEQVRRIEQRENLTDEQRETMLARAHGTGAYVFAVVGSGLGAIVLLLAVSGVVHLTGTFILGGSARFKHSLGIASYASLVSIPGAVVKIPLMLHEKTVQVQTGLGLLCSEEAERSFSCRFLDRFDLFTLWQLALVVLGTAIVFKSSTKKAAFALVPLWLIWSVASALLAGLAGR